MVVRAAASVGLLIALLLAGCTTPSSPPGEARDHFLLHQDAWTGGDDQAVVLVSDQETFTNLWDESSAADAPAIDFDADRVMVFDLGAQPHGGHSFRISDVTQEGGVLYLGIVATSTDCASIQALTNERAFILVAESDAAEAAIHDAGSEHDSCDDVVAAQDAHDSCPSDAEGYDNYIWVDDDGAWIHKTGQDESLKEPYEGESRFRNDEQSSEVTGTESNDVIDMRWAPTPSPGYWRISGAGGDDLICGALNSFNVIFSDQDSKHSIGQLIAHGGNHGDNIHGGADDDLIYGNTGRDALFGNGGNDVIYGGLDKDLLYGHAGDDTLNGDSGDDTLYGDSIGQYSDKGGGDDTLNGGEGNDLLFGTSGDDTLNGDAGNDGIWGGAGDDFMRGGYGDDNLYGDAGNDEIWGGGGHDAIWGNDGIDILYGETPNDDYYEDDGNDKLHGDHDDQVINGGHGDDSCEPFEGANNCEHEV